MRLKDILLEDSKLEIPDYINKIKTECETFFDLNEELLRYGFAIWRTSKNYREDIVTKIPPRERNKIQGSTIRSFYYSKFKPSGVPDRKKLLACQGGKPSDMVDGTDYVVFPIGSNYKLYYHPRVEDFNKPLRPTPNFISSTLYDLDIMSNEVLKVEKMRNTDSEVYKEASEEVKRNLEILFQKLRKVYKNPEEARRYDFQYYNELWDFLIQNKNYYSEFLEETYEKMEMAEENMKEYFSEYRGTKTLSKDMKDREVSVYAPDGVFYMRSNLGTFKRTKIKLFFPDKISKEKRERLFGE